MYSYTAHDGSYRKWRHADAPLSTARCYDCGIPYGEGPFGDLVLPNDVWELINPTYHKGAGLLCPNCIFERLAAVGMAVENCVSVYPVVLGDAEQPEQAARE